MTNRPAEAAPRVLVADDEEGIRFVLSQLMRREGCEVDQATNGEEAVALAEARDYDLYILDMKMPRMGGMDALRAIRRVRPDAPAVMITAFGSRDLAMEALRAGAYDYFTKPFELDELRVVLRRALEKRGLLREVRSLRERLNESRSEGLGRIVGRGPAMRRVFDLIRRVAEHDVTVLIQGESGSGKELVAEAIHELGSGPNKPFVRVNCAAIPEPLLESELFGHERGAFTGAVAAKPGKFEIADEGSILLDEIGEMPLSIQAKLLRVIQEKQVERIGETRSRPVRVRIMAATNRDLAAMVREKTFREDLFFRINVVPIHVPPLRERPEDIPALVEHFVAKHNRRQGNRIVGVEPDALRALETYAWPGNVRELENTLQRAMVMATGMTIDVASLPDAVVGPPEAATAARATLATDSAADLLVESQSFGSLQEQIDRLVEAQEKRIILAALRKTGGHRQETADLLGISRKSLHNKMQKYELSRAKESYDTRDDS